MWQIEFTQLPDMAEILLAQGYEPYAVLRMADGLVRHYFRRQVEEPVPPEHLHAGSREDCLVCQHTHTQTLKEVGARYCTFEEFLVCPVRQ